MPQQHKISVLLNEIAKRDIIINNLDNLMKKRMQIKFGYERCKTPSIVQQFLYIHGGFLDKIKLLNLIFLSDREHLIRYGRPIVGGSYFAMSYGLVCSEFLDDLNLSKESSYSLMNNDQVQMKNPISENTLKYTCSKSDIEILQKISQQFCPMDTFCFNDYIHSLNVWKNNYHKNEVTSVPYEDFFLDFKPIDYTQILEIIYEEQENRGIFDA